MTVVVRWPSSDGISVISGDTISGKLCCVMRPRLGLDVTFVPSGSLLPFPFRRPTDVLRFRLWQDRFVGMEDHTTNQPVYKGDVQHGVKLCTRRDEDPQKP